MWREYYRLMRWNRPVGAVLLAWPGIWALLIIHHGTPPLKLLLIFIAGAWLTRSMGCIMNDITDRHIDPHVKRTASRPLAKRTIPLAHAYLLMATLAACAGGLLFFLNLNTFYLAIAALPIIAIYPRCKRFFVAPQLVLGIAFSWPILMAYSASDVTMSTTMIWLFLATVFWIIGYDTIYAMSDREDDAKMQVHSLARFFGKHAHLGIDICYFCMFLCLLAWHQTMGHTQWSMILVAVSFITPCRWSQSMREKQNYQAIFQANQWWGGCLACLFWVLSA